MASFDAAIHLVLLHEGGYSNDPDDPGGETKYGISKHSHPDVDIKNLTVEQAKAIYKNHYWLPIYDQMDDQRLATGVFDFGVNAGTVTSIKTLQRALNEILSGPFIVDGIFGPATLAAVNATDRELLRQRFTTLRIIYYASLNKPKFLNGWIRRAMEC